MAPQTPPTDPSAAKSLPPLEWAKLGGTVLMLVASFLPMFESPSVPGLGDLSDLGIDVPSFSKSYSAWSNGTPLFPIVILILLFAIATVVPVVMRLTGGQAPAQLGMVTSGPTPVVVGVCASLTVLSTAVIDTGYDTGIGLWLLLIGVLAWTAGVVMTGRGAPLAAETSEAPMRAMTQPVIVGLASAGVILIASFLPVYSVGGYSANAWESGLLPLYTLPVLFALGGAALFALVPARAAVAGLGLAPSGVLLALSAYTAVLSLCFLITENPGIGFGLILTLLASIGMVVGTVLETRMGSGSAGTSGLGVPRPPTA